MSGLHTKRADCGPPEYNGGLAAGTVIRKSCSCCLFYSQSECSTLVGTCSMIFVALHFLASAGAMEPCWATKRWSKRSHSDRSIAWWQVVTNWPWPKPWPAREGWPSCCLTQSHTGRWITWFFKRGSKLLLSHFIEKRKHCKKWPTEHTT